MPNTRRPDQLGRVIAQELSELMRLRVKDPRIGFASITGVNVSRDLSLAKVYISVMGTPEEQRETMRLAYYEGLSQTEIAERTGQPLGTVKTRMRLALRKLRDRLAGFAGGAL